MAVWALRVGFAGLAVVMVGVIVLSSGDDGRVLSITPPLSIERDVLDEALAIVLECLR